MHRALETVSFAFGAAEADDAVCIEPIHLGTEPGEQATA